MTMLDESTRTHLEIWSDVACPWCFIGRRNLSIALADLEERDRPRVTWRAYQLDPSMPEDGVDAAAYFTERFPDTAKFDEARGRLVLLGEELGIEFRFDRQRVVTNTVRAHRMIAAAAREGEGESVLDLLFAAYFERGIDIGDPERLAELVLEAVLDQALADRIVAAATEDPATAASVLEDFAQASELGITGVPCFVADRRAAVPGAVPPNVLARFLAEAAARNGVVDPEDDDDD